MCKCLTSCKGQACQCKTCVDKGKCGYVRIDFCRWDEIGGKKRG